VVGGGRCRRSAPRRHRPPSMRARCSSSDTPRADRLRRKSRMT
jgi:hypothetical protein